MKSSLFSLFIAAAVATTAMAQTTWTGNVDTNLTTSDNWDNGLPSSVNLGTINAGANVTLDAATTTGYFVTQNGGTVAGPANSNRVLNSGNWTISGGSFSVNGVPGTNGTLTLQNVAGNQNFSVFNTGEVTIASTTGVGQQAGRTANLSISGGSFTTRNLNVNDGSTLNISGGSFTANNTANASGIRTFAGSSVNISGGTIISNQEFRGNATVTFSGGTSTFLRLNADPNFRITLSGTTAGSLTATNGWSGTATNRKIDWLSGTGMSMTLGVTDWAQTEWDANRMFFNGSSGSDLGLTWAQVIDPLVGFNSGGGTYFNWNGGTNTLSLEVIPEPSTMVLLAFVLTTMVIFIRRRRQA